MSQLSQVGSLNPGFQDSQGGYHDLQRALSKGSFGSCADCKHCSKYGGGAVVAKASPPSQIWKGDQDALRFLTRQNGQVTSLWKELYEGDGMTWEVMMKFREKPKSNTALMHTYGKKFNDNTYSSSHRRRAVGIFVGPSGQHHIFGCAGSNVHTGDKGPDLPRSCNFFCIAASSIDAATKRSWSGFAD